MYLLLLYIYRTDEQFKSHKQYMKRKAEHLQILDKFLPNNICKKGKSIINDVRDTFLTEGQIDSSF